MTVRTLFNPFYSVADNLASCWMARGEMQGEFLILNGDTLFEPAIACRLLQAPPAPITLAVDRKPTYDDDDMKVKAEGSRLQAIGKSLPLEVVSAESIGFLRFSAAGGRRFVEALETEMSRPQGLNLWYLSVIDALAKSGVGVEIASIEGLEWGEMDFPGDLARNEMLTASWTERAA
jgi:choline kinase